MHSITITTYPQFTAIAKQVKDILHTRYQLDLTLTTAKTFTARLLGHPTHGALKAHLPVACEQLHVEQAITSLNDKADLAHASSIDVERVLSPLFNSGFVNQFTKDVNGLQAYLNGANYIAQLKEAGFTHFYTDFDSKKPCVIIDDCIELIDESNIEYLLNNVADEGVTYFESYISDYVEPFTPISEGEVLNVENQQHEITAIADIDSLIEQAFEIEFLVLTDDYYDWTSSLKGCEGDRTRIEEDYKIFASSMMLLYNTTEDKLVSLDATLEAALEAFDEAYSD